MAKYKAIEIHLPDDKCGASFCEICDSGGPWDVKSKKYYRFEYYSEYLGSITYGNAFECCKDQLEITGWADYDEIWKPVKR